MRELDFLDGYESSSSPGDGSTTHTLANGAAATNVTGLAFDETLYRTYVFEMDVKRATTLTERRGTILGRAMWNALADAWVLTYDTENQDSANPLEVTLTLSGTKSRQVQAATDTQAGASYVGNGKWKILRRYSV